MRFLTLVLSLWISGRIVLASSLTEHDALFAGARLRFGTAFAETQDRPAKAIARIFHIESPSRQQIWAPRIDRVPISVPPRSWTRSIDRAPVVRLAEAMAAAYPENIAISREGRSSAPDMTNSPSAPAPLPMAMAHSRRWNGSAWVFWREKGNGITLTSSGQLGGSQAGVRLDRRLTGLGKNKLPVLLYGRLTAALKAPHQGEAAIGMALKPLSGRLPLTIGAERRIALDNSGRNAFALVAAGGLNPTHVVGPIMAEGYAQAGMVGFSRRDVFVDGRASLSIPLDKAARTKAGASISGGAQPGVSRLDIGPMVETRLPLGAIQPRLVVEWRQKIAGNARPGSGLTVILASDF